MKISNSGAAGRSPLVGRTDEFSDLKQRWARAQDGHGNVVVISGEAGIGKSRLGEELESYALAGDVLTMRFHCSALHSNNDLHPVHEYLIRYAGTRRSEPDDVRRRKIERMLDVLRSEQVPERLLSGLVALGGARNPANVLQSPRKRRGDLLTALIDGLSDLAAIKPLLLILEDAQWLDPTSQVLLEKLVQRAPRHRLLVVVTARPEYGLTWIGDAHTAVVIPRRLSRIDALALVRQIAPTQAKSLSDVEQIIDRSEGVPLFLEELSRESGPQPGQAPKIPDSLQFLLATRLDKVGPAKRMAQVAAVLGKAFSHEIGAFLWGGSETEFAQVIADLMAADILRRTSIGRGSQYSFRHPLLQEAAYASLLQGQRTVMHADIVRTLSTRAVEVAADQPEVMAHHCDSAELHLVAAGHWLVAGKTSVARGAVDEPVNYFRLGLASAKRGPRGEPRDRLEFELNSSLGPALMALEGYASDDALAAFVRARKLLSWSRSSLEESHVLLGVFNGHFGRGEFVHALQVGDQTDRLLAVGFGGYPVLKGQALCMMGDLVEAHGCLERALERYDPLLDMNSGLFCRADVVATSFLAKVEFAFGNLERARQLTDASMALAREQGHPIALAIGYLGQLFLAVEIGDLAQAQTLAEEAHAHVDQNSLGNYRIWIGFHRAALSLRADPGTAITEMRRLLEEADVAGTLTFMPAQLGLLGAAFASIGHIDDALSTIDRGLALAQTTRGLEAVPALRRLRGKTLAAIRPADAVLELEASLEMARDQRARIEELRSATVLARVLKDTERRDECRTVLAGIYAGFTQGHQFPDLKQAARVLASLA